MIILIHVAETKKSISTKIGAEDYSYYFVKEKYKKILEKFTTVIEINDPDAEVDFIYNECKSLGIQCLFLSFTPPFKTSVKLECPTISVFAWEYMTIPTDTWGDNPLNDWRNVLGQHGYAITHSSFSVQAVKKAMGTDFPVWSIPSPVWDGYAILHDKNRTQTQSQCHLSFKGIIMDFNGKHLPDLPFGQAESGGQTKFRFLKKTSRPKNNIVNLHITGIVYISVFNPNDGRKNWIDLISGYVWAFREIEDVTLIMKLSFYDIHVIYPMVINEIKKLMPFKCRVIAIHGFLDKDQYMELIRGSTYVVNTSHGEGQCLPLMEFMSAGKPAIAPSHSAMKDYINKDNAFVIKSSIEWKHWPHDPRHILRTFQYRIDWESLLHAYLESYQVAKDDPDRYFHMSDCAVESLRMFCSEAVVDERLKYVLQERGMLQETPTLSIFQRYKLISGLRLIRLKQFMRFPSLFKYIKPSG